MTDSHQLKCPDCESEDVSETGLGHSAGNTIVNAKQYKCNNCGKMFSYPTLSTENKKNENNS